MHIQPGLTSVCWRVSTLRLKHSPDPRPLGRNTQDSERTGRADSNPSIATEGAAQKFISELKTRTELELAAPPIPSVAH